MKRRFLAVSLVTVLSLLLVPFPSFVTAQATVPVTVTLYRLIEIDNPDNEFFAFHGDYYAEVRINGFAFQQSSEVSYDPGFGEGIIYTLPLVFDPFLDRYSRRRCFAWHDLNRDPALGSRFGLCRRSD